MNKDLFFNYTSQIYLAISGLIFLPLYAKILGSDAFGIIAFHTLIQSCFAILDAGMGQTLGRETTLYLNNKQSHKSFLEFYNSIKKISICVAFSGSLLLILSTETITNDWLNIGELNYQDVIKSLYLISLTVGLRWLTSLNKGVIYGAGEFYWHSKFSICIATFRYIGVLAVILFVSNNLISFFIYQIVVAIIELLIIKLKVKEIIPEQKNPLQVSFKSLKPRLLVALPIATSSLIWVILSQVDKFVLSNELSLTTFGYYSLATSAAAGIFMMGTPITTTFIPKLVASNSIEHELISTYRKLNDLMFIVVGGLGVFFFFSGESILYLWTGNSEISSLMKLVISNFGLGNAILLLGGCSYCLQVGLGNVKFHTCCYTALLLVYIPITIYFGKNSDYSSISKAWLLLTCIYTFILIPYYHFKVIRKYWFSLFLCLTIRVSLTLFIGYAVNTLLPNGTETTCVIIKAFMNFIFLYLVVVFLIKHNPHFSWRDK